MSTALISRAAVPRMQRSVLRPLMSFPVAIAALLALLAVLTVRSRFNDPDMWWHLKTGQVIATTHAIPQTDLFSYTTHHHSYVAHEWLSQLSIYAAYHGGGYAGLMLWFCLLSACILVGAYVLCTLYGGDAKVALAGALAVWFFGSVGFSIRPQLVGYLLLVLELIVLELGRTRSARWLLLLPPLFGVWIMGHGSFAFGLLIAFVWLGCAYVPVSSRFVDTRLWPASARRWLSWALAGSLLALLANPAGLGAVLYPFNTLFHQPVNLAVVSEWSPLSLVEVRGLALLGVLGAIFMLDLLGHEKLHLDEMIVLLLAAFEAASHARLLFPFGIVAAPILCRMLASRSAYDPAQDRPSLNAGLVGLCIWIAFVAFPKEAALREQVAIANPVRAVEYIRSHHLDGPIINEYVYGGYLIWAAPEYPVFIDGRADVYEWAGVLPQFGRWAMLQENPNELLNKYGVNLCLLRRASPMTTVLGLMPGWERVYEDDASAVFQRRSSVPEPS